MTDDDLVLYYYGDGLSDTERADIERALDRDSGLAARYAALRASLDAMSPPATSPPDSSSVERWRAEIDRLAGGPQRESAGRHFDRWSFLVGSAVTAALALGVALGVYLSNGTQLDPPVTPDDLPGAMIAGSSPEPSAAFLRGIKVHLRDSRNSLATIDTERRTEQAQLALELIGRNRLYERAAERNDAHQLARVLRAFERVLMQLAAEDLDPELATELRTELLFELSVVLTKLEAPPSDARQTI